MVNLNLSQSVTLPRRYIVTKAESSEQGSELLQHVFDGIDRVLQDHENRLTFDSPRLAERYVEGRLHVLVGFSVEGGDYFSS